MSVDLSTIKSSLDNNKDSYLDLTHQLNNYNEIYNVNFYLKNMNTLEHERLERASQNIKTKVLKLKQEYMLMDYSCHEYKMRSNIMYASVIVVAFIFIIIAMFYQDKIAQNIAIIICIVVASVYLLLVIFILLSNSKRRNYAWEQYYWQEMKKKS